MTCANCGHDAPRWDGQCHEVGCRCTNYQHVDRAPANPRDEKIVALREQVRVLVEALKPFAELVGTTGRDLMADDLCRARDVLNRLEEI